MTSKAPSTNATPKAGATNQKKKKPKRPGVIVKDTDYKSHAQKVKLDPRDIPDGMTEASVHRAAIDVIRDADGHKLTENTFIGRFWERTGLKMTMPRESVAAAINDAIEMLSEFRKNHLKQFGFMDANGKSTWLSASEIKILDDALEALKSDQPLSLDQLRKRGLLYVDQLKIGTTQYKDGMFILQMEGHYIWLVNTEFKTRYSGGGIAQSSSAFVRLAGSSKSDAISFVQDGTTILIGKNQILFNPMWLHAQVTIKESVIDATRFQNHRVTQDLRARIKSQKKRLMNIAKNERSDWTNGKQAAQADLLKLTVPTYLILSDTNLRGLRRYFEAFIALKRRQAGLP